MVRMSVRDVRLHWPKAEKALAKGEEIVVTRDSKPVARLLPFVGKPKARRKRFDPKAHMRWLNKLWKGRSFGPSTDESPPDKNPLEELRSRLPEARDGDAADAVINAATRKPRAETVRKLKASRPGRRS